MKTTTEKIGGKRRRKTARLKGGANHIRLFREKEEEGPKGKLFTLIKFVNDEKDKDVIKHILSILPGQQNNKDPKLVSDYFKYKTDASTGKPMPRSKQNILTLTDVSEIVLPLLLRIHGYLRDKYRNVPTDAIQEKEDIHNHILYALDLLRSSNNYINPWWTSQLDYYLDFFQIKDTISDLTDKASALSSAIFSPAKNSKYNGYILEESIYDGIYNGNYVGEVPDGMVDGSRNPPPYHKNYISNVNIIPVGNNASENIKRKVDTWLNSTYNWSKMPRISTRRAGIFTKRVSKTKI
jgi:hypothetical protein